MATAPARNVWVLGAGFSRALGAPLFKDLFRSDNRVRAACKGRPPDGMLEALKWYLRHAPREMGGEGESWGVFWRDPEEFLDVVESAIDGSTSTQELLLTDHVTIDPKHLADMGIRALAVECSHFLKMPNPETERWLPYRLWANQFSGLDTVITFNYDRIPEILEARGPRARKPPKIEVVLPDRNISEEVATIRSSHSAPVLKLHGSVDWYEDGDKGIVADSSRDPASDAGRPVLGIPGPGKAKLKKEYSQIGELWAEAESAVRSATRLLFVGYRFPPTDAEARLLLLGKIKEASYDGRLGRIDIVLGADTGHPDVVRMKGLLARSISDAATKVRVEPLYAEDFIGQSG